MTALVLSTFVRRAPRLQALRRSMTELFAGIQDGLSMAEHYQVLSSLTDGELARRGITRADIPRVVAKGLLRA